VSSQLTAVAVQGNPRVEAANANTGFMAVFVHLSFLLAVKKRIAILRADELCLAVFLRAMLHHCNLVGPHTTSSYVPDLSHHDKIMQTLHSLFDRDCEIKAVNLQDVQVICLKSGKRCIDGIEYSSPR
jgi:hypothetical protein